MIIKMHRFSPLVNQRDIRKLFETYGRVKSVIITPKKAFITMTDNRRAQIAINNLNGMKWKGWTIVLTKFSSKKSSPVCRTSLGIFRMF